jgi:hypothetical protein
LFAQVRDFIELGESLLEFKVVDGFIQSIQMGFFDGSGNRVAQLLKSFLRITVAGLEQGSKVADGRGRPFRLKSRGG